MLHMLIVTRVTWK